MTPFQVKFLLAISTLIITQWYFIIKVSATTRNDELCLRSVIVRNQKELYADPNDCHQYYQCFYHNETFATSISRRCADGFFWHDQILQCMPEAGETPCLDRCLDDTTSAKGCYAGTGCRQFFICSNTGSYGMCCPEGTWFVEKTCSCDEALSCNDHCVQQAPLVPTSVAPPKKINRTVCQDSFGTLISTVQGEANAYYLLDEDGKSVEKMSCGELTAFNVETCRCDIIILDNSPTRPPQRQPVFWAPFAVDTLDHSRNKFATFVSGGAQLDLTTSSLRLNNNNGHVSIPGLKTFDLRNKASFCAQFKCNGLSCTSAGAILSNYQNSSDTFTVTIATRPINTVSVRLNLWNVGVQLLEGKFDISNDGWNHVCLTYDGNSARLYLNGALVDTIFSGGYLSISHGPYLIGFDEALGYFSGNVRNVLVAPFAMTPKEIEQWSLNHAQKTEQPPSFLQLVRPQRPSPVIWEDLAKIPAAINSTNDNSTRKQFFLVMERTIWRDADQKCKQFHGRIGMLKTQEEFDRAASLMSKLASSAFWLGLKRTPDNWTWSDDSPVTQLWLPNLPILGNGDCCYLVSKPFGLANKNCNSIRRVLCEVPNSMQRFQFPPRRVNWAEADGYCHREFLPNGRLAMIRNVKDVADSSLSLYGLALQNFWVACRKQPATWQWLDDAASTLPVDSPWWQDAARAETGLCGSFSKYGLIDSACDNVNRVFCERFV